MPRVRTQLLSVPPLYFDDLLYQKVREFNPTTPSSPEPWSVLQRLPATIYGNREFLTFPTKPGDLPLSRGGARTQPGPHRLRASGAGTSTEVTEEFAVNNGIHCNREDVVFLINGIPVLVIECKNAHKKAIALGIDQIRRYHAETPEMMVPEMIFTATEAIGFSYGVTWNTLRRHVFNWRAEHAGQLEAKVKSFCAIPHVLVLYEFIVFAEKDEELTRSHPAPAPS